MVNSSRSQRIAYFLDEVLVNLHQLYVVRSFLSYVPLNILVHLGVDIVLAVVAFARLDALVLEVRLEDLARLLQVHLARLQLELETVAAAHLNLFVPSR